MKPPLRVSCVASAARAIPKSMTQGPSEPMSTLLGFRSRWITPALCTEFSASAAHPVSWRAAASGSGPCSAGTSSSARPGMYVVASHGCGPFVSWSTTGTM